MPFLHIKFLFVNIFSSTFINLFIFSLSSIEIWLSEMSPKFDINFLIFSREKNRLHLSRYFCTSSILRIPIFTDSRMYDKPGPYLKMCYELPYLLTGSTFNLFNDEKVSELYQVYFNVNSSTTICKMIIINNE